MDSLVLRQACRVYQFIRRKILLCPYMDIGQPLCLSIYLSLPSIYLSICSIYLSFSSCIYVSIYLSPGQDPDTCLACLVWSAVVSAWPSDDSVVGGGGCVHGRVRSGCGRQRKGRRLRSCHRPGPGSPPVGQSPL